MDHQNDSGNGYNKFLSSLKQMAGNGQQRKIGYIMSRFPKLTETFILYEILAMEELGIDVEVYPLIRENQKVTHPEAERMVERANFHPFISLRILLANLYFLATSPLKYFEVLFEMLSGTWGSSNFFFGALGIFPKSVRFAYEMRKKKVTHIHAHFATHPVVSAMIIKRLVGIPFSFTAHGSDLHVERRMLDLKVEAASFAVTISEYNKAVMLTACDKSLADKIRVIHCGVDVDLFRVSEKTRDQASFNILCVASFEEVKGHEYLIEACKVLKNCGLDFKCHMVGEGPLMNEMREKISQLDLVDQCILYGPMERNQVLRMLQAADVFVLPSVPTQNGKREGIPVVLMEAMACGLPVISSKLSGIPELVADRKSGYLTVPRDYVALAKAINDLYKHPETRVRMGQHGRGTVLRDFNLKSNAHELAQLYLALTPGVSMQEAETQVEYKQAVVGEERTQ